jgi:hypothetical protein
LLSEELQEEISEEDFDNMVEYHEMREAHHAAIEEAVMNNDFDAFVTAHKEWTEIMHKEHEEDMDEGDDEREDNHEMTEEKLQERFDSLVAYYNENGELPEMQMEDRKNNMNERKEEMRDNMEQRRDNIRERVRNRVEGNKQRHFLPKHRGIIKNAVKNADGDQLKVLLEKIEKRMELIEAEENMNENHKDKVLDFLLGIMETIEEMLAEQI